MPGPGAKGWGSFHSAVMAPERPVTPADLTAHRKQLAAALHDRARPPGADEGAVERLLPVFEELVSNALRHGHAPVRAEVTTFDQFWLIDVTDAAADRPPTPAVGRAAAHGGLGLYLVAHRCGAPGGARAPCSAERVIRLLADGDCAGVTSA